MNSHETSPAPFVKIILPAMAGLALSAFFDTNPFITGSACLATMAAAWILQKHEAGSILAWASILLFFFTISEAATPKSRLPYGEYVTAVAQIDEQPSVRGRWQRTSATVGYYKTAKDDNAPWLSADESIQLYVDTCYIVHQGMQIAFRGWMNAIDTTGSSYGNLMRRRGFHRRLYLTPGNMLKEAQYVSTTPVYYASQLHSKAAQRLDRLTLDNESHAVVSAMVIGDRRFISNEMRQTYNKSGSAHILAVSGLHVGIVFLLINLLLYLLPTFRYGHIVKNSMAILCIWLYALTTGMSPSVIRAATMASFAQLALATSSQRNTMNIILGTAVVMLALNPNYLSDPSFLLSFSAVLTIVIFYRHLFDPLRSRRKLLNIVTGAIIVGFAATVGTAPLVSYWFGNSPIIGILTGPLVIMTAYVIVLLGMIWIIAPIGILQNTFSVILDTAANLQNRIVEWSAAQQWAIFEGHISLAGVFLCYAVLVISYITICSTRHYTTISQNVTKRSKF